MNLVRAAMAKLRQQQALWGSWFVRVWGWLWVQPEVTAAVLVTALSLTLAISFPDCWEVSIRAAGMTFELLGVGVVAWGLHHTRRLFAQPTLLESIRNWLREFPPLRRHVRLEARAGSVVVRGGRAYGLIEIKPRPGGPLDERVTALEMNLNQVLRSVHSLEKGFDTAVDEHARLIESERKAREEGDKSAHDKIYEAVASGLHLERLGVAFLLLGIAFATMSGEIASFLGASPCGAQ